MMNSIQKTNWRSAVKLSCFCRQLQTTHCSLSQFKEVKQKQNPHSPLSSKEIRKLFIDYFVHERDHTYVHSSPVFLKNDPSLLFVNAGMNQFKSKLLGKVPASHKFYSLKRAANSQKCIRVSGKHNDLDSVGHDLHHHTFFEMLGNWSFGDYFKAEACKQSWHLLTEVYGLPKNRLYVTYFGGDDSLGLPCDEETRNIWLNIGIPESHILPFGMKDNFWDMGETGPCGPCTEIHYDFSLSPEASASHPPKDLREIWNLVFIQYKREKGGILQPLPNRSVDTGMGLERLAAVIQGKNSNYDTDLFQPLFNGIEKEFGVRPYSGHLGAEDIGNIDTAYRTLSDHMRMITVAVADGVFPDIYDEGHVLRKIIRKATFTANKYLKTPPGALSKLIPYVAETLDFFPEIMGKTQEVIQVLNEEEKMLHKIINKGRKVRNRMALEVPDGKLDGKKIHELHTIHGLDKSIIQDLASEINLTVDWEDYQKIQQAEDRDKSFHQSILDKNPIPPTVLRALQDTSVPQTIDFYKYHWTSQNTVKDGVQSVNGRVLAIVKDGTIVNAVEEGQQCLIVTDKTNFYYSSGGQVSDIGKILSEDFVFQVTNVHFSDGYVFHEGKILKGRTSPDELVVLEVDKDHRIACACNHTATHLLNVALRKQIPYTSQRSSHVGPKHLRFGFTSRALLSTNQIEEMENFVNSAILHGWPVKKIQMSFDEVQSMPNAVFVHGEEYPDNLSVILIGNTSGSSDYVSVEPCCGTHVLNTSDIEHFVITKSKSLGGTVKTLNAVTGPLAKKFFQNGKIFNRHINDVNERFLHLKDNINVDDCRLLLKDVKDLLHECNIASNIPLRILKRGEDSLKEIKQWLNDYIDSCQAPEMPEVDEKTGEPNETTNQLLLKLKEYASSRALNPTIDKYKYDYSINKENAVVTPIEAMLHDLLYDGDPVQEIEKGLHGIIVTDQTNFYSKFDGQEGDKGAVIGENVHFDVTDVHYINGCVFHEGWVREGTILNNIRVQMNINGEHRYSCCANHTATHLVNAALKKLISNVFVQTSFAGSSCLEVHFKSKTPLTEDILQSLEDLVNSTIAKGVNVKRSETSSVNVEEQPHISSLGQAKLPDVIPVISIGVDDSDSPLTSSELCFGTHVSKTSDIGKFIIITGKVIKSGEKVIRAVTGKQAKVVDKNGMIYDENMRAVETEVLQCLESDEQNVLEMWDMLKAVRSLKEGSEGLKEWKQKTYGTKNFHEVDLPLLLFRNHQDILSDLASRLHAKTKEFVQKGFSQVKSEMALVLEETKDEKFVVRKIETLGDGKRIVNYALSCITDKPALFIALDGSKSIICSCSVPEELVTPTFSAVLWMEPVGSFLKGKGRAKTQKKDPAFYFSIQSNEVHKIHEALCIAREYVESNL